MHQTVSWMSQTPPPLLFKTKQNHGTPKLHQIVLACAHDFAILEFCEARWLEHVQILNEEF